MAKIFRERIVWPHPEWWALSMSGAAWLWIACAATIFAFGGDHNHTGASSGSEWAPEVIPATRDWMMMVVAMMVPLAIGPMQATAARSLWRRRHRAIGWWLAGYAAPWIVLGFSVSLLTARFFADDQTSPRGVVALAFGIAAIWQVSPARQRALRACHRTPSLAPAGWRANRDCVRYGWMTGVNCVATCGVLMLACWLLGHGMAGLAGMMTVMAITFVERFTVRPDPRVLAVAVGAHAVLAAAILP